MKLKIYQMKVMKIMFVVAAFIVASCCVSCKSKKDCNATNSDSTSIVLDTAAVDSIVK